MTRYLDRPVNEPGLRLFCFHHAGGGASLFRGWRQALHPHATVWPVLLPGRERRAAEPCHTDMAELVADLDAELDEYLTGPHLFFGHSMGAEIAYRLARRRHRDGRTVPRALLVSGCAAPALPLALPLTGGLDDAALIRLLTDLGGLPAQLLECAPLLAATLPVVRDDLRLCAADRDSAGPALPCPIHLFGGDADPMVDEFDLAAWRGHTIGHSTVRTFPGGHFYLLERREELFGQLRSLLRRYARAEASLPC